MCVGVSVFIVAFVDCLALVLSLPLALTTI